MTTSRAVLLVDHQAARLLQPGDEPVLSRTIHAHAHPTAQHGSAVRSEHEFFGAICDEIDRMAEVLVTGSHTALADFRHYVDKHRVQTAARIAGYDVVDHPSDRQLLALARKFFDQHGRLA